MTDEAPSADVLAADASIDALAFASMPDLAPLGDVLAGDPPQPPFLRIPAELRNQIYEEVLVESEGVVVIKPGSTGRSTKAPALLQSCQQIRREALKLHYSNNTFAFPSQNRKSSRRVKAFVRWVRAIGPVARQELREVRLSQPKYSSESKSREALIQYDKELRRAGCELQKGVVCMRMRDTLDGQERYV